MSKAKMYVSGLLILCVLLVVFFSNNKSAKPIKIGGLFGLTGYASFAGESSRDGFLMALEDSGMKIPYVIEDTHSDQKVTLNAVQKLINSDRVSVVVGPEWLEFNEVVLPVANKTKTLFISPWMTAEPEWLNSPYYFTGTASERWLQKAQIEYMKKVGIKKIAFAYHNNAWSLGNIKMFKEELLKQGGIEIVGESIFNMDEKDLRTEILKIKKAHPDAIYSAFADDEDQGIFNKQMHDFDIQIQNYVPLAVGTNFVTRERFGKYMNGVIYPTPKQYKNIETFNLKYEKRFNKKPAAISASVAYDMTKLVIKAIKDGAETADEISSYIKNMNGYEGYSNFIKFNNWGQIEKNEAVIHRITEDGKSDQIVS